MPKFTRTIEDFDCEHCGAHVTGNGYTNHCPQCLYSKHVDVNPGDRAATCGGLMRPIGITQKKGEYVIQHRCVSCGHQRPNKMVEGDSFETILTVSSQLPVR